MLKDKLKNIIPEMENLIDRTKIDGLERGFTFRTNTDSKIEEFCQTGSDCKIDINNIAKKEGTRTGDFHTHPRTTMKIKMTHAIGHVFSCADIISQINRNVDHGCVGTEDEIVCSTLKSHVPIEELYRLHDCASLSHLMVKRKIEIKEYTGSEFQKENIKKLDKLEAELDKDLIPYMDFEIIKKISDKYRSS